MDHSKPRYLHNSHIDNYNVSPARNVTCNPCALFGEENDVRDNVGKGTEGLKLAIKQNTVSSHT